MNRQFLISQMIEDDNHKEKEQFYTVMSDLSLKYIGDSLDWSKAFTEDTLYRLRNIHYKKMKKAKVYTNGDVPDYTNVVYTAGTIRNTSDKTAIHTDYNKLMPVGPGLFYSYDAIVTGYNIRSAFTTNNVEDGYYLVDRNVDIPSDASLITGMGSTMTCTDGYITVFNNSGQKEVDAENEHTIWLKHESDKFKDIRGIKVSLASGCKLPVNMEFQILKDDGWATVHSHKFINFNEYSHRFYDEAYNVKEVRWVFKYDTAEESLNEFTKFIVKNLAITGTKKGGRFVLGSVEDFITDVNKGMLMEPSDTYGATSADLFRSYNDLYYTKKEDGKVHWISRVENVLLNTDPRDFQFVTGYGMVLVSNQPPKITNVQASNVGADTYVHIHKEDVVVSFDITDPEGDKVGYTAYVNTIDEHGKIIEEAGLSSGRRYSVTIEGKHFTNMDANGASYTGLYIQAFDTRRALSERATIWVYKANKLPTVLCTMHENILSVTVTDPDNDLVSCKASVNGIEFGEFSLQVSPATYTFVVPSKDILIGKENTILLTASDDTPGEKKVTKVEHKFIGTHYGMLFADKDENVLTTEFDEVLAKLDFGVILTGQISEKKEVKLINRTGNELVDINIKTTANDSPSEGYVVEFDKDEDFNNPSTILNIPRLESSTTVPFYVRVKSKTIESTPQSAEFDVTGESNR